MNRKVISIAIILVFLISGIIVVSMIPYQSPPRTVYHYERNRLTDETTQGNSVRLIIEEVLNCEISISFRNDSELVYSVDIEFYEPKTSNVDFTWYDNGHAWIGFRNADSSEDEVVEVKSIDIVLGNSFVHGIRIQGRNVSSSIWYTNGARLLEGYFQSIHDHTTYGDVFVFMDTDVNVTQCGFNLSVSGADTVTLDIRNPESLGGFIGVDTPLDSVQLLGWTQGGSSRNWSFTRNAIESMQLGILAEHAIVSLLTQSS